MKGRYPLVLDSTYMHSWEESNEGKRTRIWKINGHYGVRLGTIKWYTRWRQYAFFPEPGVLFNEVCMREIASFLTGANREQKRWREAQK